MQSNPVPVVGQFSGGPAVEGDSATRSFGLFFLGALALVTIGAGVGIGVGNIAHYRYFGVYNQTNTTNDTVLNARFLREISSDISARLWSPINDGLKKRELSSTTDDFWLNFNKLSEDNNDH